jgi:hypothetical protein
MRWSLTDHPSTTPDSDLKRSRSLPDADELEGVNGFCKTYQRTPSASCGASQLAAGESWTDVFAASLAFHELECRSTCQTARSESSLVMGLSAQLKKGCRASSVETCMTFELDDKDEQDDSKEASQDVFISQGESVSCIFSDDVVRALRDGKTLIFNVHSQSVPDVPADFDRRRSSQTYDSDQARPDIQGHQGPFVHTVTVCLAGISDEEYIKDILIDLKDIVERGEDGYWCYGMGAYIDST